MPSGPLKWLVPVALVLSLGIGVARYGKPEWFPLAPWDMFSRVPNHSSFFGLKIHAYKRDRLAEPVFWGDYRHLRHASQSITNFYLVQKWGAAVVRKQPNAKKLQAMVVANILKNRPSDYELIVRKYNPLEMYLEGEYAEESFGRFTHRLEAQK